MIPPKFENRGLTRSTRAFTLVELMVVVAIVGVLAAIGIVLFTKHINAGRSAEATHMIQAIRAAQERYRAETQRYLDASASLIAYYPSATPNSTKVPWDNTGHSDWGNWERLNVTPLGQVFGGYATVAGSAGSNPGAETLDQFDDPPTLETQNEPWYLIHAKLDVDADTTPALYLATNLNGEVYVENQGE